MQDIRQVWRRRLMPPGSSVFWRDAKPRARPAGTRGVGSAHSGGGGGCEGCCREERPWTRPGRWNLKKRARPQPLLPTRRVPPHFQRGEGSQPRGTWAAPAPFGSPPVVWHEATLCAPGAHQAVALHANCAARTRHRFSLFGTVSCLGKLAVTDRKKLVPISGSYDGKLGCHR
eukprot:gene18012-biopygen18935